jgi:hypothetical protein
MVVGYIMIPVQTEGTTMIAVVVALLTEERSCMLISTSRIETDLPTHMPMHNMIATNTRYKFADTTTPELTRVDGEEVGFMCPVLDPEIVGKADTEEAGVIDADTEEAGVIDADTEEAGVIDADTEEAGGGGTADDDAIATPFQGTRTIWVFVTSPITMFPWPSILIQLI